MPYANPGTCALSTRNSNGHFFSPDTCSNRPSSLSATSLAPIWVRARIRYTQYFSNVRWSSANVSIIDDSEASASARH
ncbi:hypothetical protein GGH92_007125, partial [Coemansia sp. RSA 2673]